MFEEALRFYGTPLDLSVTYRSNIMVGFETSSFCLYVERAPTLELVFEFNASNLSETKETLLAAGCRVESEDPSRPNCYIRDPFGLIFNIAERGK